MLAIPLLHPGETSAERARRLVESLTPAVLAQLRMAGVVAADLGERVQATAVCRQAKVRVIVRVVPWAGQAWEPAPVRPRPGTIAAAILDLCRRDYSLSGRAIASRLGQRYNSYFRGVLSQLRRDGWIIADDGGYRLAEQVDSGP